MRFAVESVWRLQRIAELRVHVLRLSSEKYDKAIPASGVADEKFGKTTTLGSSPERARLCAPHPQSFATTALVSRPRRCAWPARCCTTTRPSHRGGKTYEHQMRG